MSALVIPAAGMGGFSVSPNFPENQNPESQFFDILVTPGQRQEFSISVHNRIDQPITVMVEIITASTNAHGAVDYTDTGRQDEETLRHSLADMATIAGLADDGLLTIPGGHDARVPIVVNIPAERFEGIILGSVRVTEELTEEQMAEGGMIVNRASFLLPIRLQQEWDPVVEPDFALGEIYAGLSNYRAAVIIEVRNPQPRISRWATVNAQIYAQGENTPTFTAEDLEVEFAPNSIFALNLRTGTDILPGHYRARVQVELDGRIWNLESPFYIAASAAAGVNQGALDLRPDPVEPTGIPTWVVICIIALVVLIAAAILFWKLKKSDKKGEEDKNKALEQLKQMDQEELKRLMEQVQQQKPEDQPKND